jgi:TetR/AcrR family transcriptional regulator, regulator of cefoperazone and chloramphenicol sensitivity
MTRKRSSSTREKLLSAAADVFMEKGFRDATVSEICSRAGANISAVNYHFRSKEALYQQAWRHSYAELVSAHPLDGGISAGAPAEERLRGHMKALIRRISDEHNRDFYICQMEIANPTGLLEEIVKVELNPQREKTQSLVRELLGLGATEQQVVFCETCVISMCINPISMRRVRQREGNADTPSVGYDLEAFADHVVKFSLAGIEEIKDGNKERNAS